MTKWCGVPGPKEIWHTAMDMSWSPVKKLNRAGLPRVRKATGSMVHIEARGGWSMVHGHNSQWLILVWRYVYDLIKRYCILYIYNTCIFEQIIKSYMIQICMYTIHTHMYLHIFVYTCTTTRTINNKSKGTSSQHQRFVPFQSSDFQSNWPFQIKVNGMNWIWWSQDSISGQWFSGGRKECDKCAGAELKRPSTWGLDVHRW